MKIDKLTPEQEKRLVEFREECFDLGLRTDTLNRAKAEETINALYEAIDLPKPKYGVIFGRSHYEILTFRSMLKKDPKKYDFDNLQASLEADRERFQKKEKIQYEELWTGGNIDIYWFAFYDFIVQIGGEIEDEKLKKHFFAYKDFIYNSGPALLYPEIAFVSDYPDMLKFDNERRLHNDVGPAIRYRDGYSVYAWHGTRIPSEWIEDKATLKAEVALQWENIEQRRCAMEILGWHNILKELNAKVIDADVDPEIGSLVEADIPNVGREKFLHVLCGTKREFAIPVPPDMKTALQAQAWTWGLEKKAFVPPEVRT